MKIKNDVMDHISNQNNSFGGVYDLLTSKNDIDGQNKFKMIGKRPQGNRFDNISFDGTLAIK